MTKYHFKIHGNHDFVEHSKGENFRYFSEALDEAKASARDLVLELIDKQGDLTEACVEISDESGKILAALPVQEVLKHPNFPRFKDKCG